MQTPEFYFVVGIAGRHEVGKTTLATQLISNLEAYFVGQKVRPTFHRMEYATPIKQIVSTILSQSPSKDGTYRIGAKHYTGRQLMEIVGAEAFEELIPHIWSQNFVDRCDQLLDPLPMIIVDDVRLLDQADNCDFLVFLQQEGNKRPWLPSEKDMDSLFRWDGDKAIVLRSRDNAYSPATWDVACRIGQCWQEMYFVRDQILKAEEACAEIDSC